MSEEWNETQAAGVIAPFVQERGGLLPALQGLQEAYGFVDKAAVPLLADKFNLSQAEVHGVISFYDDFRSAKPGRHIVHICRAEACQAMGAEALVRHAKKSLNADFHVVDPTGSLTLAPVYCLGNCACSPSVMVDGEVHGRVSAEKFDAIIADLDKGEAS